MTDPTPTTPITIQDRIRMALSILSGGTDLETIRAQMYGALMRTTSPLHYPWLSSIDGRIASLDERLDKIQSVLGAEPYSTTETANIRALLMALLSAQGNVGISPDEPGNAIVGSVTSTLNGRRYVVWNSDIPGLTRSENNISLTATNGWTGYAIYVQSEADTFQSGGGDEWPTNSWLEPPLTGVVEISVSSQYAVRAYMRVPANNPITFDLLPDGTYHPYNYGTGPWPVSVRWNVPTEYIPSDPFNGPTMNISTRFRFVPFNNQGATVVQYYSPCFGVSTQPVSGAIYVTVPSDCQFAISGGNGQISFHVTVEPEDWPS